MPFFPSMPEDATTKHVFTAHPAIYSHWVRVSEAILRGPSRGANPAGLYSDRHRPRFWLEERGRPNPTPRFGGCARTCQL